jgi:hypothetical protein
MPPFLLSREDFCFPNLIISYHYFTNLPPNMRGLIACLPFVSPKGGFALGDEISISEDATLAKRKKKTIEYVGIRWQINNRIADAA